SHSTFSFPCYRSPLSLPSFPTRRSSDLHDNVVGLVQRPPSLVVRVVQVERCVFVDDARGGQSLVLPPDRMQDDPVREEVMEQRRSEEHTSELQSRFDLVCRLLLEKKNKN